MRSLRKVFALLCGLLGLVLALIAAMMGWSATIYMPIGVAFGIAEFEWYPELERGLTNLFWHVAPGLGGGLVTLLALMLGLLLFWSAYRSWTGRPAAG